MGLKKFLILREFKVLLNDSLNCIVSQGSAFWLLKTDLL